MNRCAIIFLSGTLLGNSAQARDGLGTWCELKTPRFHIVSDLSTEEQLGLVDLLNRFAGIATPYLPGSPVTRPGPLKIIVFSRRSDFLKLTGKHKFAAFMQPSLRTNRLLIGPVRGTLTETTLHEYAHFLSRNRLDVSLPTWFDEGLANLLGNMTFTDTHALIGELPSSRMREQTLARTGGGAFYQNVSSQRLDAVLSATSVENWPQDRINAFYDWSWLLVHYLYLSPDVPDTGTDRRAWLTTYLSGTRDLPAFLDLSVRQLEKSLERYLRNPEQISIPSTPVKPASGTHRCLDEFDRDHELARAILWHQPRTANRLIEPYLKSHAENVELLVTRARIQLVLDNMESAQLLGEAALSRGPDNAAARILSADITVEDCLFVFDEQCRHRWRAAADQYRSALAIDPDRFDAIVGLGLANLYTGRPGEAVNYLRVAYTRAPWAAATNYYLGESFRLVGDTRARGYLENARNWASVDLWRRLAEESLKLLSTEAGERSESG